jgi:hypothetical protein
MKITFNISEIVFQLTIELPCVPRVGECVHLIDYIHAKYPKVCKQLEVYSNVDKHEDGWQDILFHVKSVSYFFDENTGELNEICVFLDPTQY